jgi:DNA (cytosine-5)-methyltransferase 1
VTAEEALSDLPALDPGHARGDKVVRVQRDQGVRYCRGRPSTFACDMRNWPGFSSNGLVLNHVTRRLTERDYRVFKLMKPGDDYPAALEIARRLFKAKLARLAKSGERNVPRTRALHRLKREYVPPYDETKFANKWRKMESDQPARTLMAHLGKDTYSHIHFDSEQRRTISVREAARLQSFPDGFEFASTLNPSFKQIGNSVPPLLAFALARHLMRLMGRT